MHTTLDAGGPRCQESDLPGGPVVPAGRRRYAALNLDWDEFPPDLSALHVDQTNLPVRPGDRESCPIGRKRQGKHLRPRHLDVVENLHLTGPVFFQFSFLTAIRGLVEDLLDVFRNRAVVLGVVNIYCPVAVQATDRRGPLAIAAESKIPDASLDSW